MSTALPAGALAGVRVLDLSRLLPGPFCSLLLADLGADVIKVEDTAGGDPVRLVHPRVPGVEDSAASAAFLALNRGKRSVRIDLKAAGGPDALLALVRGADVVLESFRPGVLDRLGVGFSAMRAANPRIVVCAITGFGQDGPLRDRPGHDIGYLSRAGVLDLAGDPAGPPLQPGVQIADLGGGALMAAVGILAALRHADRTGEGQHVDIAMTDGALSWTAMDAAASLLGHAPARGRGALSGGVACYRPYACADGWVSVGALEPKFWKELCDGLGRADLLAAQFAAPGSPPHAELEAIFAARTRAEWSAFADAHPCCLEPVLTLPEALASEETAARKMVVELAQPGAVAPVRVLGSPIGLSATPADPTRPAPVLGQHTAEVLREAGYDDAAIAALEASGAVAGPPPA